MKNICSKAGLENKGLSNISARKHLLSTCRKAGVPDGTTMKVSNSKCKFNTTNVIIIIVIIIILYFRSRAISVWTASMHTQT